MTESSLFVNISNTINDINSKLSDPMIFLLKYFSLQKEDLPCSLKIPITFFGVVFICLYFILSFAYNFLCNMVGLFYPVLYSLALFNGVADPNNFITVTKYWILYGSLTLVDNLLGYVMYFVPGYSYLKILVLYMLIKNDFIYTKIVFDYFAYYNMGPLFEKMVNMIKLKARTYTSYVNFPEPIVLNTTEPKVE